MLARSRASVDGKPDSHTIHEPEKSHQGEGEPGLRTRPAALSPVAVLGQEAGSRRRAHSSGTTQGVGKGYVAKSIAKTHTWNRARGGGPCACGARVTQTG